MERRVGFARTSFFAGRDISVPLDELNAAAREWCFGRAARRPWPDDDSLLVRDAFASEREKLIPLPDAPFPTDEVRAVRIDKTCYARFDTNDYSVPPDYATASLTLVASRYGVRILDGVREVAAHARAYGRQQQISDPEHVKALVARKRHGRSMSVRDMLLRAVPRAEEMLTRAGCRKLNVARCARTLNRLLDSHGADELDRAIAAALERGSCHPNTVRSIIETRRRARGLPNVSITDSSRTTTPRGTDPGAYDRVAAARKEDTT